MMRIEIRTGFNKKQISLGANNENNENVESGGDEITTIEELEGLVGDDCMELCEEQVQMIKKEEEEEKQKGFSFFGPIWRNHCGPM